MPETAEDKLHALVGRVGKVRRWLIALLILRIAALCLIFVSAYIGIYAWLDHRFNFDEIGRATALVLLLAGIGLLLQRLVKLLLGHISFSSTANYIENKRSFNQQLVTAIEYHENKRQYPYSKGLAEQLVLRVDKDCRNFNFDSTVKKWQGYALGAIILFGLLTAWFYIRDNYLYFSSYFARLMHPAASVTPLPSTSLEPITKNIVAEPNSEATFTGGIESMTAKVAIPKNPARREWVKPYKEQINNNILKVIHGSDIALNVQTTEKLKEVKITGLDGETFTKQLNGTKEFDYYFNADRTGSIKFDLVNEQGFINENPLELEVVVKSDEPPKFKLICPEGDYLTTDVASVPITFEITDDFGLDSAKMFFEIPGYQPKEVSIPIEKGSRSQKNTYIVELEQYNLSIGDSILFYAEATDVDTGSVQKNRTSSSEVYFIEIRPYRQIWRPGQGGGPGNGGMPPPVELLNILEYTRAILKKTWTVADKPYPTEQDRSVIDSIDNDVRYCAEQLAIIRDDPELGFIDGQKTVLNEILNHYEQASRRLSEYNANSAIAPEKDAYRLLRKFIVELELKRNPPTSGQGQQPKQPDSVKMQENPEFPEYEKERIQSEIKKVQQELTKLSRQQKNLKNTFENFLKQQSSPKSKNSGVIKTASAGQDDENKRGSASSQAASESKGIEQDKGIEGNSSSDGQQRAGENRGNSKGQASGDDSSVQGRGPGDRESPDEDQNKQQGRGQGNRQNAAVEARLRMLQAKQRALQEQTSRLKQDLQQLPQASDSEGNQGRTEAKDHLDKALAGMDDFQEKLAEARYQVEMDQKKSEDAVELMESARREMDLAAKALDGELTLSEEEKLARQAKKMAEQLAEDADALDESLTPEQEQDMLARLEAAKRLLEAMPEPQWTTPNQSKNKQSSAALVFTRGKKLAPAETARQLARQFWSISIEAGKRRQQLSEDEPSDVKFFRQENDFFENAAKFDAESVQK